MDKKFWSQVDVKDKDECWLWMNQPSQTYGVYYIKTDGGRKAVRPHRYAWEQHNKKKIPEGLMVCHSCDTPKCCNPNHLWLGTNSDNQKDARQKYGHFMHNPIPKIGEEHHSSKLTEAQVLEIRYRLANGEKNIVLAKEFGVADTMIAKIKLRKSWKHI